MVHLRKGAQKTGGGDGWADVWRKHCFAWELFRAMAHKGGRLGFTPIDWFNGGLFDDDSALPVTAKDVEELILGGGGPICLRKGLQLMAPPPAQSGTVCGRLAPAIR